MRLITIPAIKKPLCFNVNHKQNKDVSAIGEGLHKEQLATSMAPSIEAARQTVKHVTSSAPLAVLEEGGGEAELLYTLLHRKSSTAVMLASGSISTTL